MKYRLLFNNLCRFKTKRLFMVMGIIAICFLVLQTLTLPDSLDNKVLILDDKHLHINSGVHVMDSELINSSIVLEGVGVTEASSFGEERGNEIEKDFDTDENFLNAIVGIPENDYAVRGGIGIKQVYSSTNTSKEEQTFLLQDGSEVSNTTMVLTGNTTVKKIMTMSEMNGLLHRRRRRSSSFAKPQWSARDKELLFARSQIENAPITKNNGELYAPLFRNVSMFKRSYELMYRILKVYVYGEGKKPIFHQPILKGLYASEGWFMKLMEGNKKFTVKDPRKAHLFYMPFSSRLLKSTLNVSNSAKRPKLRAYLENYPNMIAAKYPFWNRTRGADHFFVACHDSAPYATRHHMERCVKSMCNADVTQGFTIGKDASLPETYVRSARNPVRDIGGEPPSNRSILAFFAGSMHGYLRPILLSHWENKDPDMKILGRMPFGVASKMNYIRHMKTSKYCICAKGYNVNSPRVVEAIFYECVPVIISDNFVPPFFEVLNWESFSVIVAEKDIPNLKNVLVSIPYEKYVALQTAVKKAQRHFVWHSKPVKYDLFHMTLHSIWFNRVFTIKGR